jgi:hypothetical protein
LDNSLTIVLFLQGALGAFGFALERLGTVRRERYSQR